MIQSIAITGGTGNLATKLFTHLAAQDPTLRLVALDLRPASAAQRVALPNVQWVECDLADGHDRRWQAALAGVDAVVHFAAQNPYLDATWEDAAVSLEMTLHVANAALAGSAQRVVFATSNHVMGRYKDDPLWEQVAAGQLTTALMPGTGTVGQIGANRMDSTPYATSKLMGERVCKSMALAAQGRVTFAGVRIGWCQPGDNLPSTLSAAGDPTAKAVAGDRADPAIARAEQWFREMWLSNRDFCQLFERAIFADGANWPNGYILVNGMSNNRGMKWGLDATRHWLGYTPQDDVYANRIVNQ